MESPNLDTFHEEFIEIIFDVEVKSMYTFKEIGYYWMNEKQLLLNIQSIVQQLSLFYYLFQVTI